MFALIFTVLCPFLPLAYYRCPCRYCLTIATTLLSLSLSLSLLGVAVAGDRFTISILVLKASKGRRLTFSRNLESKDLESEDLESKDLESKDLESEDLESEDSK